jgi:hypothetical protein
VLALTLVAAASDRYRLLPRACVLASALVALGFAAYDPDRRIAERNVERHRDGGSLDVAYLQRLSADAVPALAELPEPARTEALAGRRHELRGDGWSGFNLARVRAREALADGRP